MPEKESKFSNVMLVACGAVHLGQTGVGLAGEPDPVQVGLDGGERGHQRGG